MSLSSPRTIRSVLVANRGEIALRVMKACRELGIATVAVYGEGEADAPHVRYADRAYRVRPEAGSPYLAIDALVATARAASVDAVHPGYGFLAENPAFATAVTASSITWIGPAAETIATMGDKIAARRAAARAGVGSVPGTTTPVESAAEATRWADAHGYPVAVKAAAGGGGRGFRVARRAEEMGSAFSECRGEAERYFGNPDVYLERYLERPRHVEVQVFGDQHGHVVALGERDCSIQRRHQKLIEESPSPAVTEEVRADLKSGSVALATSVSYVGAGTIEYLLAADGSFSFLEMNTRIQVEHTVTEMVTGIDLVKEQLRVASGEPLSFSREALIPRGWAIECRINAEDAGRNFAPAPGTISRYREPTGFGVRVDGAMGEGDSISPMYDSLIAKLVVWGRDRPEAIARMRRALGDFEIAGVETTIPFHERVLGHEAFVAGEATTTFLDEFPDVLTRPYPPRVSASPNPVPGAARPETTEPLGLLVEVNGQRFDTRITGLPGQLTVPQRKRAERPRRRSAAATQSPASTELVSAIQGTVIRVEVAPGDAVATGDVVCVVEAMKMENEIGAHRDGRITELHVAVGDSLAVGAVIASIVDEPARP
ncbi:MAG: Biotin carboxylase of acetyl-CoA carboxylase [uncultured Thermomicrobiales bacterium]|uniref:Biotin carboxylase of acetyl-CoA carboxylase n=1 Tax=uncultured Thermomicrobiales bacterium TaxID=1645740 RepID=A0A6J4VJN4_9BACT|nr:MAG: Biotin carboxylase of acetyl-CoA carboxylase [uncultured Thermomicrobiales bacterium]